MSVHHSEKAGPAYKVQSVALTIALLAIASLLVLLAGSSTHVATARGLDSVTLQAAGLSLDLGAQDGPVVAGESLTYTLTYTNTGLSPCGEVRITDTLDAGTTFDAVVGQPSGWTGPAYDAGPPATLTWYTPSLAAGASGSIEFRVTVDPDLSEGTSIHNGAAINSSAPGDPPEDNTDVEVTGVVAQVDLSLAQVDEPDPVTAGSLLGYSLVYTNEGPSTATGVTVVDMLPAGVSVAGTDPAPTIVNPAVLTWELGAVPPGKATILVTVTVPLTANNASVLANAITIDSDQSDPLLNTEETTVHAPDLWLNKSCPSLVRPGAALRYTITYTNSGDAPATNVTIAEAYDVRTDFPTASLPPDPGSSNSEWTIGSLAPGAEGTILVTVTVDAGLSAGTLLTNTVSMTSTERPRLEKQCVTEVDESRVYLPLVLHAYTPPGLWASTKEARPAAINAGEFLTYTISLHDTGTEAATRVFLTDVIPAWATLVPSSAKECIAKDGVVTWNGTVNPGQPLVCSFSVKAAEDVHQAVSNSAQISWNDLPPLVREATTPVMVSNGGFETGTTAGWQVLGHEPLPLPRVVIDNPYHGSYHLLLGDSAYCNTASPDEPGHHSSVVTQTIFVPDLPGRPVLKFHYRILTFDHLLWTNGNAGDSLDIYVAGELAMKDNYNNYPAPVPGCSSRQDSGWRTPDQPWGGMSYPGVLDLGEWKGSAIEVRFELWTRWDGYYNTWAYLDDVRVVFE